MSKKGKKVTKFMFLVSILFVFFSLLSACSNQHHAKPKPSENNEEKSKPREPVKERWKLPITIPEGEFYKVVGWLTDNQVLYITNLEQSSSVYRYHLLTGESDLLYKSEQPIVTVQISPSKKYFLIQSSPSTFEGVITVIDPNGLEIVRHSIASHELEFEWNPYDESEVLISAFKEDWTFQMLLLDVNNSDITELELPQPFIKWVSREEIAFINWDDYDPTLFAPLLIKKIGNKDEKTAFPAVFQFSAFRNLLMTVTISDPDKSQSTYTFYDKDSKLISSFSMPHLTLFSDWLVPFNDFNDSIGKFITFRPLKSTEADSYSEGFELVTFDLGNESNQVILEGMENAPIQFSPSGEACLYGNRFEKVIDLKTKEISELLIRK